MSLRLKKETFDLVGVDGNAFSVMGYVTKAMKSVGMSKEEIEAYKKDAMSGTYDHLLSVSMGMIDTCNKKASKSSPRRPRRDEGKQLEIDWSKDYRNIKAPSILDKLTVKNRSFEECEDTISALYPEFVPSSGKCNTVGGECVRALSKINYRWFNDGDMVGHGYGVETAAPSLGYIVEYIRIPELILSTLVDDCYPEADDSKYEKFLVMLNNAVLNGLAKNKALFEKPNHDDSVSDYSFRDNLFTDDEERLGYYDEDDDYWDEDDYDYDEEDDDEEEEDDDWDD